MASTRRSHRSPGRGGNLPPSPAGDDVRRGDDDVRRGDDAPRPQRAGPRPRHRRAPAGDSRPRRDQPLQLPTLTRPEDARQMAALLHAGLDPEEAVSLIVPELRPADLPACARQWLRSPRLLDAVNELNGGAWQALEPQRRLELALTKHYAEMARFLYTTPYQSLDGVQFDKAIAARKAIEAHLAGRGGTDSPLDRFMRQLVRQTAKGQTPAQLAGMAQMALGDDDRSSHDPSFGHGPSDSHDPSDGHNRSRKKPS